jgi:anti-sigma factor RsiW
MLSVVADGEASATEVAATARHLTGCEDCARFAAVVAELKHCLRAAPEPGVLRVTSAQVKRG